MPEFVVRVRRTVHERTDVALKWSSKRVADEIRPTMLTAEQLAEREERITAHRERVTVELERLGPGRY